ncbi:MAG TPA: hypothetical protein VI685_28715 [Candidatus Angelobacter sp.]
MKKMKRLLLGFLMLVLGRSSCQGPAPVKIIKISVLASGTILLDGKQVEMKDLEVVLKDAGSTGGAVWYYRESAAAEPPPQAKEVISLIIKNRLSISLSTKPDFSDYVDVKGVSQPRTPEKDLPALFNPRMPDVQAVPDIEQIFADARKMAADKKPRAVVMITPSRKLSFVTVPESPTRAAAAGMESIVPSNVKRNIAVIGYTGFAQETFASTSLKDANKAIPFLGILLGLSSIGHSVWIFEGHGTAIAAGCRDADLLIVDSGMLPFLPRGWQDEAAKVMRNPNIMVHDRAAFQLRIVTKVGKSNRLEFRD